MCGYENDNDDDFDWVFGSRNIQSFRQGPRTDHTTVNTTGEGITVNNTIIEPLFTLQWNPNITICQGSSKTILLYRNLVVPLFPVTTSGGGIHSWKFSEACEDQNRSVNNYTIHM